ncbi:MAG: lipopolysaccharide biosynthesis protein [Candidatus Eutrophobiaceae bacterium]
MIDAFKRLQEQFLSGELSRDVAYTMGSFLALAVSGIIISVVLAVFRGTEALGIFNIAYAMYIMASQFAVWGMHYSVLRFSAWHKGDQEELGKMLATAIGCSLLSGALSAIALWFASPVIGMLFDNRQTVDAIRYASLGLAFFPMNKVLLAHLNGLQEMKMFASIMASRYFLVLVFVAVVAVGDLPIAISALGFLFSELIVAVALLAAIRKSDLAGRLKLSGRWAKQHLSFGTKSLCSGVAMELNSRVDVIIAGAFLGERAAGIYSFAALLVDGLCHMLAMIRINFNPRLVAYIRDRRWESLRELRRLARVYVLPATLGLSALILAFFWVVTHTFISSTDLGEGLVSLLILLFGLNLVCVFVPFDNLLLVTGHPMHQMGQQATMLASNITVSICLVSVLGIEGIALGTACSYLANTVILIICARTLFGWKLLANAK